MVDCYLPSPLAETTCPQGRARALAQRALKSVEGGNYASARGSLSVPRSNCVLQDTPLGVRPCVACLLLPF
jgi:hypothetical protein